MLTLGIDSGTQSTKSIILDTDTGEVLASSQAGYDLIPGLPAGHMEQDPQTWGDALEETVSDCLSQLGERRAEVRAIGVSGQQHGLVVLDKKNRPIRPAKLWCDTSTVDQCEQFAAEFGGVEGLIELAGNPILPGYTAPKLLWLKQNEPNNFQAINCVLLPHDYLNWWLTGEKRMEYGDASGTGLMNVRTRQWVPELIEFIDPEIMDYIPKPESSRKAVGLLRDNLREKWGLSASTVVSAGGGDNMMGAIGTGNVAPGLLTASLGTSGTLYSFSDKAVMDPRGEIAAFCDSTDHWLPLACTMNVTVATEQVRKLFGWNHQQLEHEITAVNPGANGLLFLPYLNGERLPNLPGGTGVFHGLTTANMEPASMARATMEGVTLGLSYGLERFRQLGLQPTEIRLTGGGSKSGIWRQIAADAFGATTVCLRSAEGAALGSAIQACWASEFVNGQPMPLHELTDRLVQVDESTRTTPSKEGTEIYRELLHKQADITRQLHSSGHL